MPSLRSAVVPFVAALTPMIWYVNRNLTTERLPPHVEPTADLILAALGGAVLASAAFAAVASVVVRTIDETTAAHPTRASYGRRVLQPDDTALAIFAACIALLALWALVELAGVGPSVPTEPLSLLVALLGLPLLVLAPLAIRFHWAVILGLVCSVLWISLLSALAADVIRGRPLPIVAR